MKNTYYKVYPRDIHLKPKRGMLLVTGVEAEVVSIQGGYSFYHKIEDRLFEVDLASEPQATIDFMKIEHVRSHVIVDEKGDTFEIGMTEEVSKTLRLPFEVMENQQKMIQDQQYINQGQRAKLQKQERQVKHFRFLEKRLRLKIQALQGGVFWERGNLQHFFSTPPFGHVQDLNLA